MSVTVLTVGGFLGAGKTTLIARTARLLAARGQRVVVVTNDQAPDLVDTALIRLDGVPTAEVSGACFCCAFTDFAAKTRELIERHRPDVVLAEPVGSCVDIAATVLRPLAAHGGADLRIAPFTVLVDPAALRAVETGTMDPATAYIYRQQVREADILLISKCDNADGLDLTAAELAARVPTATILRASAATGAGVETWLDAVLASVEPGGSKRIQVDYDTYADGEAALGWLNATVELRGPADWPTVLMRLIDGIALPGAAHLKCLLRSGELVLVANQVSGRPQATLRRMADGTPSDTAQVIINARIAAAPAAVRQSVESAITRLGVPGTVKTIRAFAPGRPVPVHRMS